MTENDELVPYERLQGTSFFSWCGHTIKKYKTFINEVTMEGELLLCEIDAGLTRFSFGQGGVCIFHDSSESKFVAVDMVSMRAV